jgi:hypothetical protein
MNRLGRTDNAADVTRALQRENLELPAGRIERYCEYSIGEANFLTQRLQRPSVNTIKAVTS